MRIVSATSSDLDALVDGATKFIAETPAYQLLGSTPVAFARSLRAMLQMPKVQIFVAVEGEAVVGAIGMCLIQHPWTLTEIGSELFWWVDPDQRGHRAAGLLYNRAQKWATAEGARAIQMISPVGAASSKVASIYHKRGFRPLEVVWWKKVL